MKKVVTKCHIFVTISAPYRLLTPEKPVSGDKCVPKRCTFWHRFLQGAGINEPVLGRYIQIQGRSGL